MLKLSFQPAHKTLPAAIEKVCTGINLTLSLKGSLQSIGENVHWHFKNGKQKGVLEITWLKQSGEIILSVHQNRRGGWEEEIMHRLKNQFCS